MTPTVKWLNGGLSAVALAACAMADNPQAYPMTDLEVLRPVRVAPLGGEWAPGLPPQPPALGNCLVFDQVWPDINDIDGDGSDILPLQGGTACGLPGDGYRWVFPATTLNLPLEVEDFQVAPVYAGICIDRVIVVADINGGFAVPPPAEALLVAVGLADEFNECGGGTGPLAGEMPLCNNAAASLVLFDFGIVPAGRYALDLAIPVADNYLQVPMDGEGAVQLWLVSYSGDPANPANWAPGTAYAPYMWGTRSNSPSPDLDPPTGDTGPQLYRDVDFSLTIDPVDECFEWHVLSCPNPAGPMIALVASECGTTPTCPGDVNGDSTTNFLDFAVLAQCWDQPCADLTGDATTDFADFAVLSGGWGCPQ